MALARANPFFQEFQVVFKEESLGIVIQNINNLPTVKQVLKANAAINPDAQSEAERGGVMPGCVISGVGREEDLGLKSGYREAVRRVKRSGRPLVLTFRQLHAVADPGWGDARRRYWQGYLRAQGGPQSWTGRFYVLRADGDLAAFAGKGRTALGAPPLAALPGAHRAAVVQGAALRRLAQRHLLRRQQRQQEPGGRAEAADEPTFTVLPQGDSQVEVEDMMETITETALKIMKEAPDPSDSILWSTIFALCFPDTKDIHVFRAESSKAKLDWICALTTLAVARDLGLASAGNTEGGSSTAEGGAGDGASPKSRRGGWITPRSSPQKRIVSPPTTPSRAVGTSAPATGVLKQGYLRHHRRRRCRPAPGAAARGGGGGGGGGGWKQRWFAARADGRLAWHRALPADPTELPAGTVDLRQAELCTDPVEIGRWLYGGAAPAPSSPELEDLKNGLLMMVVPLANAPPPAPTPRGRGGAVPLPPPPLVLRALGAEDRAEWLHAMVAATAGAAAAAAGAPPTPRGGGGGGGGPAAGLSSDAAAARLGALRSLRAEPGVLFRNPEVAFALMIGSQPTGGGIPREAFQEFAGQYFLPLCDAFTADLVFANLVAQYEALRKAHRLAQDSKERLLSVGDKLGEWGSIGDLVQDWAEGYFSGVAAFQTETKTRTVASEPLEEGGSMAFPLFRRYVGHLSDVVEATRADPGWAELRVRLNLDPREVLVKWEDFVADRPAFLGAALAAAGRLYLTDRHVFLQRGGGGFAGGARVLVVPLATVQEVRLASRQAVFAREDDVVELVGCRAHTVLLHAQGQDQPEDAAGGGGGGGRSGGGGTPGAGGGGGGTEGAVGETTVKLVFSKLLDMFGRPAQKRQGRRNIWFYMLQEMVEAHKLALELQHLDPDSRRARVARAAGGGLLGALGSKIRDIQSGWSQRLERGRLPLWAAANLIRTRALVRTTERFTTVLMICSHQNINENQMRLWHFLHDHTLHTRNAADSVISRSRDTSSNNTFTADNQKIPFSMTADDPSSISNDAAEKKNLFEADSVSETKIPKMQDPQWFQNLVNYLAHTEQYKEKKQHLVCEFNASKFKDEWNLFWAFFDQAVAEAAGLADRLQHWRDPLQSAAALALALAVAWHDLLAYLPSLLLLGNVVYIVVSGSQVHVQQMLAKRKGRSLHQKRSSKEHKDIGQGRPQKEHNDHGRPHRARTRSRTRSRISSYAAVGTDPDQLQFSGSEANSDAEEEYEYYEMLSSSSDEDNEEEANRSEKRGSQKAGEVKNHQGYVKMQLGGQKIPVDSSSIIKYWAQKAISQSSKFQNMKPASLKMETVTGNASKKQKQNESGRSTPVEEETVVGQNKKGSNSEDQGILNLINTIKTKLGEVQHNIHNYNTFWLKTRSLYTWARPVSTKMYLLLLICCAIFLALCPARYLYTAGVLFFFSKPLRDDKPPLPIILLLHFFKGIPTGSHTHTHLQMESIYNSESTSRQLALRRRLHDGEDSNIVINSSSSSNEEEEHKNSAAATTTDGGN